MQCAYGLPAPAKLNLFLHVLGRRSDGYHELQSAFVLIDLADWIDVERRDDGALCRHGDVVGDVGGDLALRAARLLREASGARYGADITVRKGIPAGAGLGGGSSDAATVLLALNRIWDCGLPRERLAALALQLGADVPFFVHGNNAFAEGRGERLTALALPPARFVLVWPQVHVSTQEIFSDPGLTRNTKATKMADFAAFAGADSQAARDTGGNTAAQAFFESNDLQAAAERRCPAIGEARSFLTVAGLAAARMTGSGSAVFAPLADVGSSERALAALPPGWMGWVVRQLPEHPLLPW